jgi:hypothetical protein
LHWVLHPPPAGRGSSFLGYNRGQETPYIFLSAPPPPASSRSRGIERLLDPCCGPTTRPAGIVPNDLPPMSRRPASGGGEGGAHRRWRGERGRRARRRRRTGRNTPASPRRAGEGARRDAMHAEEHAAGAPQHRPPPGHCLTVVLRAATAVVVLAVVGVPRPPAAAGVRRPWSPPGAARSSTSSSTESSRLSPTPARRRSSSIFHVRGWRSRPALPPVVETLM